MISINTTSKLNGIYIQGDFDDLNNLYDAISEYINFYIDGLLSEIESDYVKEHGVAIKDMDNAQREAFLKENQSEITYYEEMRENILGLCYDIRHAYQGDRGIALIDNGQDMCGDTVADLPTKNLQFNVAVLYPWALYYLFTIQDMLDNYYRREWLTGVDEYQKTYSDIDIQLYRATLSSFVALLWKNLESLFGKDFEALYNYYNYKDSSGSLDRAYLTGICTYLVADNCAELSKKKYETFKKNILLVLAYENMDTDDLFNSDYCKESYVVSSKKQYRKALNGVNKSATIPFTTYRDFVSSLLKMSENNTERNGDEWIAKTFGNVDWENIEL